MGLLWEIFEECHLDPIWFNVHSFKRQKKYFVHQFYEDPSFSHPSALMHYYVDVILAAK